MPITSAHCLNAPKMSDRNRYRVAAGATRAVTWIAVGLLLMLELSGCRSTTPEFTPVDLEAAIENLSRPLPGDPAVLYRLRVSSSGGLRMALLTSGDAGRLTVSEPFGSAVSLTAWTGSQAPTFYDLRKGCRLEAADLGRVLGVSALPLPQAVRLLGGRLPTDVDDRVTPRADGRLLVEGRGWEAIVTVKAEPWRVVSVEEAGGRKRGWRLELGDHSLSVPGLVRVKNGDGRWAELKLVRLEWNAGGELPSLPELPLCVVKSSR